MEVPSAGLLGGFKEILGKLQFSDEMKPEDVVNKLADADPEYLRTLVSVCLSMRVYLAPPLGTTNAANLTAEQRRKTEEDGCGPSRYLCEKLIWGDTDVLAQSATYDSIRAQKRMEVGDFLAQVFEYKLKSTDGKLRSSMCVLAFRGTDSLLDAWHDLKGALWPPKPMPGSGSGIFAPECYAGSAGTNPYNFQSGFADHYKAYQNVGMAPALASTSPRHWNRQLASQISPT